MHTYRETHNNKNLDVNVPTVGRKRCYNVRRGLC